MTNGKYPSLIFIFLLIFAQPSFAADNGKN
ncbi:Uncharacterised protein [Zhongshania aliphaticivorans]|nr:Uncharacterised protein [Zhongshania aliphaticivorans]